LPKIKYFCGVLWHFFWFELGSVIAFSPLKNSSGFSPHKKAEFCSFLWHFMAYLVSKKKYVPQKFQICNNGSNFGGFQKRAIQVPQNGHF
jgi:hypothetical protein